MFRPNQNCVIRRQDGYTAYGMPKLGTRKKERCAIVKLKVRNDKTSVRADSSASRGNARELEADVLILLSANTVAQHDAVIEFEQRQYRIISMNPRYAISGKLDHYEVECTYWSETEQ